MARLRRAASGPDASVSIPFDLLARPGADVTRGLTSAEVRTWRDLRRYVAQVEMGSEFDPRVVLLLEGAKLMAWLVRRSDWLRERLRSDPRVTW